MSEPAIPRDELEALANATELDTLTTAELVATVQQLARRLLELDR